MKMIFTTEILVQNGYFEMIIIFILLRKWALGVSASDESGSAHFADHNYDNMGEQCNLKLVLECSFDENDISELHFKKTSSS